MGGVWAGGPQTSALCLVLSSASRPRPARAWSATSAGGGPPRVLLDPRLGAWGESGDRPLPHTSQAPGVGNSVQVAQPPTPGLRLAGQEDRGVDFCLGDGGGSQHWAGQQSRGPQDTPRRVLPGAEPEQTLADPARVGMCWKDLGRGRGKGLRTGGATLHRVPAPTPTGGYLPTTQHVP